MRFRVTEQLLPDCPNGGSGLTFNWERVRMLSREDAESCHIKDAESSVTKT